MLRLLRESYLQNSKPQNEFQILIQECLPLGVYAKETEN